MGSGLGLSPYGLSPYGLGGGPSWGVAAARAAALNAVTVRFSASPLAYDSAAHADALWPPGWRLDPLDPPSALAPLALHVERADDDAVTVYWDHELVSDALYRVTCAGTLADTSGALIDPARRTADFAALALPAPFVARESGVRLADVANPPLPVASMPPGAPLATYVATSSGALLMDSGVAGLRKRILRRITTDRGAFAHLPTYGATLGIKRLLTADRLRGISADLQRQIMEEPDVQSVDVSALRSPLAPGLVRLTVAVRTTAGRAEQIVLPVAVA